MSIHQASPSETDREQWLKVYYFVRAAFSFAWVAVALTLVLMVWSVERYALSRTELPWAVLSPMFATDQVIVTG